MMYQLKQLNEITKFDAYQSETKKSKQFRFKYILILSIKYILVSTNNGLKPDRYKITF